MHFVSNPLKLAVTLFVCHILTQESAFSQPDTTPNSFYNQYREHNPSLNYSYDPQKQIHNYSNNWDLDNDGKNDQVYFIGKGGAHLYYFLRVILSSDSITRDYPYLESDFPILPHEDILISPNYKPNIANTFFSVFHSDSDKTNSIFIKLDKSTFEASRKALKRNKIRTGNIIILFRKSKTILKDFILNK